MLQLRIRKARLVTGLSLLSSVSFGSALLLGAILLQPPVARAADLTGKFVYDGDVPAAVPVTDPKAANDFPGQKLVYQNLVVDPTTKAIAYVAVYIKEIDFPATPEAQAAVPAEVIVDNKGGQFNPHMSALWVGKQKLFFQNSDPVSHNSNFNLAGVNPLLPPSAKIPVEVAGTKLLPQEVTCTIHPWMKAYVVPRNHPYVGVSGTDGTFVIKNLPENQAIEFQAWHEKSGYLAIPQWEKGRFTMTLKAGVNDLGEIKVPAAILNK
jgi:hypothetical protein